MITPSPAPQAPSYPAALRQLHRWSRRQRRVLRQHSPVNGEVIAEFPRSGAEDVEKGWTPPTLLPMPGARPGAGPRADSAGRSPIASKPTWKSSLSLKLGQRQGRP